MICFGLVATLLVGQALAGAPIKLAAPGLSYVNIADNVGTFYSDHFAHALTQQGLQVTSARQIAVVIGVERQKQLLGCADNTSCIAELANALGVDGIVSGSIGKFEDTYQVDISIIGAQDARVVLALSTRASSDKKLIDALNDLAQKVAEQLAEKLRPQPAGTASSATPALPSSSTAAASVERPTPYRQWAWVPAAGGAVAVGVGAALALSASGWHSQLRTDGTDPATAASYAQNGPVLQTSAIVLFGVGAAGLAAAGAMFLWHDSDAKVALAVGPRGVAISGAFR